jgi:hypothetical protein
MATVGDGIASEPGAWTFGGDAAASFDRHAVRSIPFYPAGHELVVAIADVMLGPGMIVYDLGCSTGALVDLLVHRVGNRGVHVIGVDQEPASGRRSGVTHHSGRITARTRSSSSPGRAALRCAHVRGHSRRRASPRSTSYTRTSCSERSRSNSDR